LLVGANVIGNVSTYICALIILLSAPFVLANQVLRRQVIQPLSLYYVLAFGLILLAFSLSADTPAQAGKAVNFLLIAMFPLAVGLFASIARPNASLIIGWLALAGSVGSVLTGFYDVVVAGHSRAIGFVNLTNPYAMASVMLGFLSVMGFFATKNLYRYVFLLGPALACASVLFASTRAAFVMVGILGCVTAAFWVATLSKQHRRTAVTAAVVVFAVSLVAIVVLKDEFRAISAVDALYVFVTEGRAIDYSIELRLNMYYGGIRAFLDSPVFGHGWRNQFEAARPYMSEFANSHTMRWSHLHNDYVNFAALAGVMGLTTYALYMAAPVVGALRSIDDSQKFCRIYGAVVILICYAVFGMFDTSFSMELLMGFGSIATAVLLGFCRDATAHQARALK
jgi:O-antigen ligase